MGEQFVIYHKRSPRIFRIIWLSDLGEFEKYEIEVPGNKRSRRMTISWILANGELIGRDEDEYAREFRARKKYVVGEKRFKLEF
jgi:hypothetical protein